jgi:hypothetical protein
VAVEAGVLALDDVRSQRVGERVDVGEAV